MKSIDDLKKKVEELNLKAHDGIDPRFYVFDEFVPKQIPEDANDEIRFWYLIINLYGLFHDCGKYITSIHYNNKDDYHRIANFYVALNEVRSVFCHNKTEASYSLVKVTPKTLDAWKDKWCDVVGCEYEKLQKLYSTGQKLDEPVKWADLFDIFLSVSGNVLDTLNAYLDSYGDNIYDKWVVKQIDWYLKDFEAIWRAVCTYVRVNRNRRSLSQYSEAWLAQQYSRSPEYYKIMAYSKALVPKKNDDIKKFLYDSCRGSCLTPATLWSPLLDCVFKNPPSQELIDFKTTVESVYINKKP